MGIIQKQWCQEWDILPKEHEMVSGVGYIDKGTSLQAIQTGQEPDDFLASCH